jgi:CheY-like chemotaxis protein
VPKILIVEDSPDSMRLFRTLLTMRGHEIVGLAGGDGLLETLERDRPELVLMDIQLPARTASRCSPRSARRITGVLRSR